MRGRWVSSFILLAKLTDSFHHQFYLHSFSRYTISVRRDMADGTFAALQEPWYLFRKTGCPDLPERPGLL